jgi:hypothetical protein
VPSRRSSPRRTARARARSRQDDHAAGVAGSPHWPPISSEGGPRHLGPHAAAFSHVPVESGRALQTDRSDEVQVRGATPSLPFQKSPQKPAPFCPQFRVVRQQWGALEQCKAVHSAVLRNSFAASLAPRVAGVPCQHGDPRRISISWCVNSRIDPPSLYKSPPNRPFLARELSVLAPKRRPGNAGRRESIRLPLRVLVTRLTWRSRGGEADEFKPIPTRSWLSRA